MKVFSEITVTRDYLLSLKKLSLSVGLVPTMGALHKGHLSLIEKACHENDITVSSIFVNPIQFNNKDDFEKYPVQYEKDLEMLEGAGCDIVFIPSVGEMYPEPVNDSFDFGLLDKFMEGAFREGHFNGVAIVVKKLIEIIQPNKAYFGEKDFQQLQIIKYLVEARSLQVEIVACPIIRESDGLAMSSRNIRLTAGQREIAPQIFKTLMKCSNLAANHTVQEIKSLFIKEISQHTEFSLDYFEIAEETTLQPIKEWKESKNPRAFVAVVLGNVRLIDNMKIIL